ncbi:MAG: hypothetical protein WAX04_08310 [Oscillospiraceae bacterium]
MDYEKLQKKRNFWFGLSMVLTGVVIGYLMSPAKNGFNIKNICGNGWAADDCCDKEDYADLEDCKKN